MEWQPIETAEKIAGVVILGCYIREDNSCIPVVVWWSPEDGAWETHGRKSPPVQFWMPLPNPPAM